MTNRIYATTPRRGKVIGQHYCPKCKTELVRIGETVFYCPNCDLKLGAMLGGRNNE